jgi:hypothetical protein
MGWFIAALLMLLYEACNGRTAATSELLASRRGEVPARRDTPVCR